MAVINTVYRPREPDNNRSQIVGCPGTQPFLLYAKVSFSVPIWG